MRYLSTFTILFFLGALCPATAKGRFVGPVETVWSIDHRTMKLTKAFEYIDAGQRSWFVPKGTVTDGASIPQVLWSILGSPFVGPHRDASVIHDHFCDIRTRRWQEVHKVFYEAMLDSGVNPVKAWLMYKGVERFGPRWKERAIEPGCEAPKTDADFARCIENSVTPTVEMPPLNRENFLKFIQEVEGQADKGDIEKLRAVAPTLK
jgi:hypothetical protein